MAEGFDQAVLVTDPTFNAVEVVKHAATLVRELGIPTIHRVRSDRDIQKVQAILGDTLSLFSGQFYLPYEEGLLACEPDIRPLLTSKFPSPFIEQVTGLQALEQYGMAQQGQSSLNPDDGS